jgi:hypothetical protein
VRWRTFDDSKIEMILSRGTVALSPAFFSSLGAETLVGGTMVGLAGGRGEGGK